MNNKIICPQCGSEKNTFLTFKQQYICEQCMTCFYAPKEKKRLRIFISYGHDEYADFARILKDELKRRGHEVWFDEERLKAGETWEYSIETGLEWASEDKDLGRIVLIMTPYAVRRPNGYCLNEIAKALDCGLSIIPVMLIWTTPPLSIYRLQWLDSRRSWAKGQLNEEYLSMDFERICRVLEENSLDKEGVMYDLCKELNPLDFNADLVFNQTWFTGRQWVFDYIHQWLSNEHASRLLCITGKPGIGKTAIATHLLQKFPNIVAYHLCRRNNNAKASPLRAICTIAYQLSSQIPTYKDILSTIHIRKEIDQCNETALFDRLIVQPLSHIQAPQEVLIILIDGLDEASVNRKNSIANFIASEFDRLPEWLRIIVTTRPNDEVIVPLQAFRPWTLQSASAMNQQDINAYLDLRLEKFKDNASYKRVKEIIRRNAQGIFLYAAMICDEILKGKLEFDAPGKFPENMSKYYYSSFEERFKDIEMYRSQIRPALQLVMAACEPLTKEQVATFLKWDIDAVNDWLIWMGSLLLIDADGKITPFHASLFDWLSNEQESGKAHFYADKNKGHHRFCQADINDNIQKEYLLKYLPVHLAMDNDKEGFIKIFTDNNFVEKRKAHFSKCNFIKIYLDDLSFFSEIFEKQALYPIYDNDTFRQVIEQYGNYMFDKEYYVRLKELNFSEYLESKNPAALPESFRITLISYYYIIHRIDKAIEFDINILESFSIEQEDQPKLTSYASAFNIIGVCFRIAGKFEKAYQYIPQAIRIHQARKNLMAESIVEANLARVHEMDLDFQTSRKILEHGVSLIDQLQFNPNNHDEVFYLIHVHNGSTYILSELYLNINEPDQALKYLDIIRDLYTSPEYFDRYWTRYLYTMAIYHLLKGNNQEADQYLKESEEIGQNNNKVAATRAIWFWVEGVKSNNQDLLHEAKNKCIAIMDRFRDNYLLENYAEMIALYRRICESLSIDFTPDNDIDMNRFNKWINHKYDWFGKML